MVRLRPTRGVARGRASSAGVGAANLELQNRLAREARARLDAAVERAVPNYRETTRTPGGTTGFGRLIHYRDVFDKRSWTRLSPAPPPIVRGSDVQRARSFRADERVAIAIP